VRQLGREQRPAGPEELRVVAAWSGWGAVPAVFDEQRSEWAGAREQLRELLDEDAYAAARRTTINAHYTDPAIADAIWQTVHDLGFDGGRVLEPGCGAGVFLGLAPDSAQLTGVELDPSTAAIARVLYPHADVRAESFAATRLPDGYFDLVVGNVPFADVRLHDQRHNHGRHSLHNHFIVKSLALTRPGGLVAVLSSHYTLDAANPGARREMGELADLVGAVRLPTGAHRRAAGTDALTDLLIFRRREPGAPAASATAGWESTRTVEIDGQPVRINSYLAERPERVLGELAVGQGMYSAQTLHVHPRGDLAAVPGQLRDALSQLTSEARAAALTFTPRDVSLGPGASGDASRAAGASEGLWDGHIAAHPDGTFTVINQGVHEPFEVPSAHRVELRALLELRDGARGLLAAEAASLEDSDELTGLRDALRDRYSAYQQRFGPLNRFTLRRTGRTDPQTGEQRMARITPTPLRLLRRDPFAPLVSALEVFDDATQTATPAAILSERVIAPRAPRLGADNPQDALAICLDTHGRVELQEIARLLGAEPADARAQLAELVYHDPDRDQLVPAAEYLSGNVRAKLDVARRAVEQDPALQINVDALERVLPADLTVEEIEPRLGAAWIDADTHREFLAELLADPSLQVEHPGGAVWAVKGNNYSVKATSEWGTGRIPAPALAKAILEQRPVQVTDEIDDGERVRRVINPTETAAAQEKAQQLQERFAEWCWEDPDRAARLAGEYNQRFNSLVLRDYSQDGERLTLPGLARTFTPLPHQRAAVARMLAEPAVGLFHQVGAGKTAEMVIGANELRRLGLVRKPAIVVPNHMLEQFSREYLQLYPQSRVLAASGDDLAGDKRRAFVARAAANDWDAIIMTRSAFTRLPVSQQTELGYRGRELEQLRSMLERARGDSGLTVKRLEKLVLRAEQRLQERLDAPKDPGLCFEMTGIDHLGIDEAHDFKNLQTASNIADAAIDGAKRASDLHMKIEYLRSRHGQHVVTMATATPIANSVTEAHVMARYLRPDLLQAAGVEDFDAWAATFGRTVTEIEMAPTGAGDYRIKTRFARFQNVPEMLRIWGVFADVKTAEDLQLPVPEVAMRADGQRAPETVVIPASPELAAYVARLGDRAERVRSRAVTPDEDNMLKISTDGRKAALDMRLVSGQPSSSTTKLDVVADTIARVWREHRDRPYLDPGTGERSPTPGALQIVFCDLSTPSERWNAYDELRALLAARGLPAGQVRFIHEAHNDDEKARLFAACRAGHVAVIVGSTQKMGVGTNIQDRCVAVHHVDCPWRPSDVEQRQGRGVRQGNQNPEIHIYRFVVEGSFDAYSWQTVERKARFINQIMRGRIDVREIEDVGENTLSFAEVKALASGDPLILEKAHADADATRFARLERAWQRNQHALRGTLAAGSDRLQALAGQHDAVQGALAQRRDTRGERFEMTVDGRHVAARAEAAVLVARWAATARSGQATPVGTLGGLQINGTVHTDATSSQRHIHLALHGLPSTPATLEIARLGDSGLSLIRQLEHRLDDLPALAKRIHDAQQNAAADLANARDQLTRPFKYQQQLADAREHQARIEQAMKDHSQRHEHDPDDQRTPTTIDDPHATARQPRDQHTLRDHHDHPQRPAAESERGSIPREPVPDPVDRLRGPLGPQRTQTLAERVQQHAANIEQRTDAELVREREQAAPALTALDGAGAYEARRLAHAADHAADRQRAAAGRAGELEGRAEQLGWRQRQHREQLLAEAHAQQQAAAHASRELADTREREQQLHDQGRHPDDWLARDGEQAAVALAAEHELAVRHERNIQAQADHAIEHPPAHLRDMIGERPAEHAAEQRERWDQLARDLERHRLRHQVDVDRDTTLGAPQPPADDHGQYRRDRERLSRRVQDLRNDHGLQPTRDIDPPDLDLDLDLDL
jgi:N12 class adenine-specific DNA methylase